jgi:hypothetical protein
VGKNREVVSAMRAIQFSAVTRKKDEEIDGAVNEQ